MAHGVSNYSIPVRADLAVTVTYLGSDARVTVEIPAPGGARISKVVPVDRVREVEDEILALHGYRRA